MSQKYAADALGTRMKGYEATTQTSLLKRTPVIIRLDGKAFHTFTKRLKDVDPDMENTPFSPKMHNTMTGTADWLFRNVQNCALAYTQSDEISLVLRDWDTFETQQWFGGNVQKMVSVSASLATAAFNYLYGTHVSSPQWAGDLAYFDSRVFNLPKEEVANYFIWRQQDASRNSVQMLGHFHFSQKEMHGKNNSEVQDMLMLQKNVNWNDVPTWAKRGSCIVHNPHEYDSSSPTFTDKEIPIFTQDRWYIERHLQTPLEQEQTSASEHAWSELTGYPPRGML